MPMGAVPLPVGISVSVDGDLEASRPAQMAGTNPQEA